MNQNISESSQVGKLDGQFLWNHASLAKKIEDLAISCRSLKLIFGY